MPPAGRVEDPEPGRVRPGRENEPGDGSPGAIRRLAGMAIRGSPSPQDTVAT